MILVVEDEVKLSDMIRDYLQLSGYSVHCIYDGDEVIDWFVDNNPEAVLLDVMLPGKDGLAICKEIRGISSVPILMTTAKVEENYRLLGLELGADDYICKPYSPRELVARLKAVLRRAKINTSSEELGSIDVCLNDKSMCFEYKGKTCQFTAVEYRLIKQLAGDARRIFSRAQLIDGMYEDHRVVSDRTIDSHIRKIRRKLSDMDEGQEFIYSVYGAGYKFELNNSL